MSPRPDLSMSRDEIDSFLAEPHTAVISTIGPGGFPHSVTMYYTFEGAEIRMWPYRKSQKVRNLERDPRAAVLVEAGQPYQDLRGVLVRARARVSTEFDDVFQLGERLYERYFLPVTGIPFEEGPSQRIARQSEKRACIVIPVESIASWDHSKSGGTASP